MELYRGQRPRPVPAPSSCHRRKVCCGCVGRGPLLVAGVGKTHTLHSQIPPGGQVLNGAQASNLQEQLHPVDWEQKEAVSSGPDHTLSHTCLGSVPPSEALRRSPASATGHVTPTPPLPPGEARPRGWSTGATSDNPQNGAGEWGRAVQCAQGRSGVKRRRGNVRRGGGHQVDKTTLAEAPGKKGPRARGGPGSGSRFGGGHRPGRGRKLSGPRVARQYESRPGWGRDLEGGREAQKSFGRGWNGIRLNSCSILPKLPCFRGEPRGPKANEGPPGPAVRQSHR